MLKPGIPYSRIICDKIIHWHKLIIGNSITSNIAESVPELLEASPWRSDLAQVFPQHDEGVLPRGRHREAREAHLQDVRHQQGEHPQPSTQTLPGKIVREVQWTWIILLDLRILIDLWPSQRIPHFCIVPHLWRGWCLWQDRRTYLVWHLFCPSEEH